jgi:hypothetical protein
VSWEWEVLAAVVRFLFLLAPFMGVAKYFALKGSHLAEAKDMAAAGSTRAMLVSFPAQFFLAILARASNIQCQNVRWLPVALYVLGGAVAAFGLFNIPVRYFRGPLTPFMWLAAFTALSILAQTFGLAPAVNLICQH